MRNGTTAGIRESRLKTTMREPAARCMCPVPVDEQAVVNALINDKKEMTMELGNVKWFDMKTGIGQIEPNEGDFVEVNMAALRKSGVRALREGELVAYDLAYARGRSMAENLRVL